jgi:hypothetical protein
MITLHMTTLQERPNGHCLLPPPCLVENPAELDRADFPANEANINSQPLKSRISNVEFRSHVQIDTEKLPDRCQFTFSDSRQCTMARSDIHPSMCPFHAEREEQLFGRPAPGDHVVGAALDLPELYSACRDLTTAAGVNRALAQVFRLLAQRRISRQEAATFGHLAQLLLRTITLARAELSVPSPTDESIHPVRPSVESANNKVKCEPKIPPQPAPELDISPASSPACEPVPSRQHKNGASASLHVICNSSEINTYENVELKTLQNEHLREKPGGGAPLDTKTEILPAQPLSLLHQEPQDPQGPPSEQHLSRLENRKGAGVRLGIGHDGARRR